MINFYDYPPTLRGTFRAFARTLLKPTRGPGGVMRSIKAGMASIGVAHNINPCDTTKFPVTHVVRGVDTLAWAIREKRAGRIKYLVAGPAIVVTPDDQNRILCDNAIDLVVTPSTWVKDFYVSIHPPLAKKIVAWAAGVEDPGLCPTKKTFDALIYAKYVSDEFVASVTDTLSRAHQSFRVLRYGSYNQRTYHDLLQQSRYAVFLSPSESQGLALHEAWIRDVPTLVWSSGEWHYGSYFWHDPLIAAPYLTNKTGMIFKDITSFNKALTDFLAQLTNFDPRTHSLEHFTDLHATERLLETMQKRFSSQNN